jgi:hypothetical protein
MYVPISEYFSPNKADLKAIGVKLRELASSKPIVVHSSRDVHHSKFLTMVIDDQQISDEIDIDSPIRDLLKLLSSSEESSPEESSPEESSPEESSPEESSPEESL